MAEESAGSPSEYVELAELLEERLSRTDDLPSDATDELRIRLVQLYVDTLNEPTRAGAHLEPLLQRPEPSSAALDAATALLEKIPTAPRIAELLALAYARLGRIASEAAALAAELKVAQPPRLDQARRRLAELRFRELDDAEGAFELLEPATASAPADDELRKNFIEVAGSLDRGLGAARLLAGALDSIADPGARARVGFDIGTLFLREAELPQARAAFLEVVRSAIPDETALAAAQRLLDLEPEPGDPEILEPSLRLVRELSPDAAEREQAAQRLHALSLSSSTPEAAASPESRSAGPVAEASAASAGPPTMAEAAPEIQPAAETAPEARPPAEAAPEIQPAAETAPEAQPAAEAPPVEQFSPEQDRRFELEAVRLLAQDPASMDRAVEGYEAWLSRFGEEPEVRREWLALLERAERWADLALGLEAQLERVPPAVRAGIWARLGQVRWKRLGAPKAALTAFRHSLAIDRDNALSLRVTEKLMTEGEWRLLAAEILETAYRAKGSTAGLARVFETRAGLETDPQMRLVALEARIELLSESSADARRGIDLCRRGFNEACEHAPGTLQKWLQRLDGFAERLGDAELPLERLVRYETALGRTTDAEQRLALLHSIAGQRRALGDLPGAIGIYRRIVDEDPEAGAAHQALIEVTAEFGEEAASVAAIDRALEHLHGEQQHPIVLRKAAILARRGESAEALELCRALLDEPELQASTIEAIAGFAHDEDDHELYHRALELLTESGDAEAKKRALERMGDFQFEQLGNAKAAVESWKPAAQLYEDDPAEEEHARQLYERVLEALPDDRDAALRLVALYAHLGEWAKVPEAFAVLVRAGGDPTRAVKLLLELEAPALKAGAVAELVSMVDESLWRLGPDSTEQAQRLKRARTRALASDPAREQEASQAYRDLIESFESPSDVEDFAAFAESRPSADDRHKDRRWLFEWRFKHGTDRLMVLKNWARAEEEYDDPSAAITVYERLAQADPEARQWRETLCRLKLKTGDFEGGLAVLRDLRERGEIDPRRTLEVSMARLLFEEQGRPAEAADALAFTLGAVPRIEEGHQLMQSILLDTEAREEATDRLEEIAERASAAETLAILEHLALAHEDAAVPDPRRGRWFQRMLELGPKDEAAMAATVLRGVVADPASMQLWETAERLSGSLGQPERAIEAYHRALTEKVIEPELAEALGRRLIAFADKYSADSARLAAALERVLALAPAARWALDRVKLVWTSQARWDELLASYDRAILASLTETERAELLDEAALAARDLADNAERAIGYLEALHQLRPEDGAVEASLERLYQRQGYHEALARLLNERLEKSSDFKRREVQRRIVSLRLDQEQPQQAEAALEQMFSEGVPLSEVTDLLERIVELRSADSLPAREYAISLLKRHYGDAGQTADLIRLTSIELWLPRDDRRRTRSVRELVRLRLLGANGGSFGEALARTLSEVEGEPALLKVAYEAVLLRALRAWKRDPAATDAKDAVRRVLPALTEVLCGLRRPLRAFRVLEHAGRQPFHPAEQRMLWTQAAIVAKERLSDDALAAAVFRRIFRDDAADSAAAAAMPAFVALLFAADQRDELRSVVRERVLALQHRNGSAAVTEHFAAEARAESSDVRPVVLSDAAAVLSDELKEPAHAVILLELALKLDPGHPNLRLQLADALDATGRSDDAIAVLRAQIEHYRDQRSKDRALVHQRLARMLGRAERPEESLAELRAAAEMHPTHPSILHELGRLALSRDQLDVAESAYRGLVLALKQPGLDDEAVPARAEVYLDLSQIALRKAESDRAADLLDSAFEAALEAPEDLHRFENALRARGRFDLLARTVSRRLADAATPVARALALGDLVELWAEALGRPDDLREKIGDFVEQLAGELERDTMADPSAWSALFTAFTRLDDRSRFISLLESTLPRVDRNGRRQLRVNLARAMLDDPTRTSDVITALKAVLDEEPADQDAAELLSTALERDGRLEELAKLLERRLELIRTRDDGPAFAEMSLSLGSVLERLGKGADARPVYEAILDRGPADAKTLRPLADRLAALDSERLVECLEWLVEWDPAPVPALARRLLERLTPRGDAAQIQRVLEVGFAADPADSAFRDPLLAGYTARAQWSAALGLLKRAREISPDDRAILRQLIDTQHRSGNVQDALATLEDAILANPHDAELLFVRAGLRQGLDDDGAVSDLERASSIEARYTDRLIALLQKIADRASLPNTDSRVIQLVDLLLDGKRTADARRELERLLERTPNHKEGLRRIATLASAEGDWQVATSAYHELFPLLDGNEELRSVALALAETCERAGRVAEARAPLERALELTPEDPVLEDKLEQIYVSSGDFERLARLLANRADHAADPGEKTRLLLRAAKVLLEQAEDVHHALSTLDQLRSVEPYDLEANVLWAKAQRMFGRSASSLEVLRETLQANRSKRSPLVASVHLEIAHAHLAVDELFEALDALKAGFNLDRKSVDLALLLGLVALDLDDEKTAERALLSVIAQPVPSDEPGLATEARATAFFHLAALAYARGDVARARRMAGKAAAENPGHEAARTLLETLAPRAVAAG